MRARFLTSWPTTEAHCDDLTVNVVAVVPLPTVVPFGSICPAAGNVTLPAAGAHDVCGGATPPSLQAAAPMAIPAKPIARRVRRAPITFPAAIVRRLPQSTMARNVTPTTSVKHRTDRIPSGHQ